MRVLWFSNSPAGAYSDTTTGTGSWMVALDKILQERVELHVAYKFPYKQALFIKGKTAYHPIYTGNIIIENIKHRFIPRYHKDRVDAYLKIVEEVKPDIIHIHGSENDYHSIVGKTEIPVVLSVQGNPTVIAHKYKIGFLGKYIKTKTSRLSFSSMILGRSGFNTGLNDLEWMSGLEQVNLRSIKNIIGRTDWDRRITRVMAPNSRYFVVNEALRGVFYNKVWQMDAPSDKLVIHTTSGNTYYKGFETLCQALNILNQQGIEVEWRVAGVSEGSAINIVTKKYLGKNYPNKGLVLMGRLDENGLIQSLLTSHLYVMPSHIENSPNNLCEAMLLGMPCVTTLAGGSDTILINKKEGLVIQDGDPWSMAGAILELKNDWKTAVMYGVDARLHALKRHNRETIVNNLMESYRTIIENNESHEKC